MYAVYVLYMYILSVRVVCILQALHNAPIISTLIRIRIQLWDVAIGFFLEISRCNCR